MNSRYKVPLSLKLVAACFIVSGLLAIGCIMFSVADYFWLWMGVAHLLAGIGLLRPTGLAWSWALAVAGLSMVVTAMLAFFAFSTPPGGYLFNGSELELMPKKYGVFLGLALFGFFYWKFRVLTNYKTRRLFEE